MTDSDQQPPDSGAAGFEEQGRYRANPDEYQEGHGEGVPKTRRRKKSEFSILYIGLPILAVAVIVLFLFSRPKTKSDSDDLGAGIFNASGLRGHLVTRWQGKAVYQLQIEPIDPRENAGFELVTGNPPEPIYINIRVLDSSGFALCGTEVLLPFNPGRTTPQVASGSDTQAKKSPADRVSRDLAARPAELQIRQALEQDRERGKDMFQKQIGSDGQISAINAQGVLPCSADQYKHFDYWDFSTNFPTLEEQDKLLNHSRGMAAQTASEERRAAKRKAAKKGQSAYYIEGDDRITGFDASNGALETAMKRTFYIARKSEQATAAAWAANYSQLHYKCDQHAICALTRAGTSAVLSARLNE